MKQMSVLFMMLLAAAPLPSWCAVAPSVSIDSVRGTVEIQRAGNPGWKLARAAAKLYNNDMLRAAGNARAVIRYPDHSVAYVNERTQIRINLSDDRQTSLLSRHTTVFFGALAFFIEKALPREVQSGYDTKVHTPTAVVAVRGTSFTVEVNPDNGTTVAKVIEGTVLVRNILKNVSTFLGAPYQTTVAMNADPQTPLPLLESDIAALKTWVPPALIDSQINLQLAASKRSRDIIKENFSGKTIVVPFANFSEYNGSWDIGGRMAAFTAQAIGRSAPSLEISVAEKSEEDPIALGAREKARFVVKGEVVLFDLTQFAQISVQADSYNEYVVARVKTTIQVIDVKSRQIIYEGTFGGELSDRHKPENTWATIGTLACSLDDAAFAGSILGQAVKQAVSRSSETLVRYLHN